LSTGDHIRHQEDTMQVRPKLKLLTKHDFATLGYPDIAYVKRIDAAGEVAYAAHAADGSFLWQFADRDAAFAALRQHELEPVSLH
jgi:hypothetical protein